MGRFLFFALFVISNCCVAALSLNVITGDEEYIYVCNNKTGISESLKLKYSIVSSERLLQSVSYKSSKKGTWIELTISDAVGKLYYVKFPGSAAEYILTIDKDKVLCQNPDKTVQTFLAEKSPAGLAPGITDTLMIGGKVYKMTGISAGEFESVPPPAIATDNDVLEKINGKFNLKTRNGKLIEIADEEAVDEYGYGIKDNKFLMSCSSIDCWMFRVSYFEGAHYLLINREDGTETILSAMPVFSPDEKYFIDFNSNMILGDPKFNLWKADNKKMTIVWSKMFSKSWYPIDVKWISNEEFYMKIACQDNEYYEFYFKMKIVSAQKTTER